MAPSDASATTLAGALAAALGAGWASHPEDPPIRDRAWLHHEREDLHVMLHHKPRLGKIRLVAYIRVHGVLGPSPAAFSASVTPSPDPFQLAARIRSELLPASHERPAVG